MSQKEEDYKKALQMIDARISEFADVFSPCDCEKITGGIAVTKRETLLTHLLDELSILNVYGERK